VTIRLEKPWQELASIDALPGHMGVFELVDVQGQIIYIGFAGGRSQFGLRGEVAASAARMTSACGFRIEVTTAYLTRWQELLMVHRADHGRLPAGNASVSGLGRLSPA
jgi:hypothetical protein